MMASVQQDGAVVDYEAHMPLVIVGGGACGLVAGLAALSRGIEAVVLERDDTPRGSTWMSSGFIPAAGTRFQQARRIEDDAHLMAEDIHRKNHGEADPAVVEALARYSARVIEWLADEHEIPFELVEGFLYPGHSRLRMHSTPRRSGEELMACLLAAAERAGLLLMTGARVQTLHIDESRRVHGVSCVRRDGSLERIGCDTLLLACNGYGGNAELRARHIPGMADALYHGHEGNQGEAVLWGQALHASLRDLAAYQGHGSVAWPHQTLISWAVMMQGGIQLNTQGHRFSNEHDGYSEQAARVIAQPGSIAFNVFDQRIHEQCLAFEDYRQAHEAGAVRVFESIAALSEALDMPVDAVHATFAEIEKCQHDGTSDRFGRQFEADLRLISPYHVIRVTGALFHTQGGLEITPAGQVLDTCGTVLPNLLAAGGAARGVSGSGDRGYLSGNGLLSAVVMGALAGWSAADSAVDADRTAT